MFFQQKIKELVLRYNYTLNPEGIYEAIKYMYTYWPDPHNKTHIREQYINVSIIFIVYAFNFRWQVFSGYTHNHKRR